MGWANWDEQHPGGMASGNSLCCMATNGNSDDEYGLGLGLSISDRRFTEVGTVGAGASKKRQIDNGSSDGFSGVPGLFNAAWASGGDWTVIHKFSDITFDANSYYLQFFRDAAITNIFHLNRTATSGRIDVMVVTDAGGETEQMTGVPTSGDVYIAIWAASGTMKCGFSATRPLVAADMTVYTFATENGDFSGYTWTNGINIIGAPSSLSSGCYWHYTIYASFSIY